MILASILLLGNMGLSPDVFDVDNGFQSVLGSGEPGLIGVAFADDDDDDDDDRTDDKLTWLLVRYLCAMPEVIDVTDTYGNPGLTTPTLSGTGNTFVVEKFDFNNDRFT